ALWLLVLVAFTAGLLAWIPMPAIAALLLLISWSLFDWQGWRRLFSHSRQDFAIAATTFVATVSIRLEVAILLGTVLSLVTYLHRTSKPAIRIMGFDSTGPARPLVVRTDVPSPLPKCGAASWWRGGRRAATSTSTDRVHPCSSSGSGSASWPSSAPTTSFQ